MIIPCLVTSYSLCPFIGMMSDNTDISISMLSSSCFVTGVNLLSKKAEFIVFLDMALYTSWLGKILPMQPRSCSFFLRVTNVPDFFCSLLNLFRSSVFISGPVLYLTVEINVLLAISNKIFFSCCFKVWSICCASGSLAVVSGWITHVINRLIIIQ